MSSVLLCMHAQGVGTHGAGSHKGLAQRLVAPRFAKSVVLVWPRVTCWNLCLSAEGMIPRAHLAAWSNQIPGKEPQRNREINLRSLGGVDVVVNEKYGCGADVANE